MFIKTLCKFSILIPFMVNAQMCDLIENQGKSKDSGVMGQAKEYFNKIKPSDISKVIINVELDNKKCKSSHPILVTVINNSSVPIDEINLEVGSWFIKKNGKSYFVGYEKVNIKDSKYTDFYIKPNSKHSFCAKAPNEEWTHKLSFENASITETRDKLFHTFKIDELYYGLIKDSCYIGFDE